MKIPKLSWICKMRWLVWFVLSWGGHGGALPAEAIACKVITTKTSTEGSTTRTIHGKMRCKHKIKQRHKQRHREIGKCCRCLAKQLLSTTGELATKIEGVWISESLCVTRGLLEARTAPSSWGGFFTPPLCAAMNKVGIDTGHAGMNRIHCQIRTGPLWRSKHPYSPSLRSASTLPTPNSCSLILKFCTALITGPFLIGSGGGWAVWSVTQI